jgi:hypothetical protein
MSSLSVLLGAWLSAQPVAGAVLFVAAALICGAGLVRVVSVRDEPASRRLRRCLGLLGTTAAFMGLAWGGYFALNSSNRGFGVLLSRLIAGEGAVRKQRALQVTNFGGGLDQAELLVKQSVEKQVVQEIPQGPGKPTLYLPQQVTVPLDQQSIIGFRGSVELHLVDPAWESFECRSQYDYDVLNESDSETMAEFWFPISSGHFYKNISVLMDGKPEGWSIREHALYWKVGMAPHQQRQIEIVFQTRGQSYFAYDVFPQRVIQHFSMTIMTDSVLFHPISTTDFFDYSLPNAPVWKWTIEHAFMGLQVGAQLVIPPANDLSYGTTGIVDYAARGLVLLLALVALTWLICGVEIDLVRLGLLASLVCAQFLGLMAVYPLWMNAVVPVLLFALIALALAALLLRRMDSLSVLLSLMLLAIFAGAYPFVGLVPGERERNAIDGAVQAGMILYLFGLTFYARIRARPASISTNYRLLHK